MFVRGRGQFTFGSGWLAPLLTIALAPDELACDSMPALLTELCAAHETAATRAAERWA